MNSRPPHPLFSLKKNYSFPGHPTNLLISTSPLPTLIHLMCCQQPFLPKIIYHGFLLKRKELCIYIPLQGQLHQFLLPQFANINLTFWQICSSWAFPNFVHITPSTWIFNKGHQHPLHTYTIIHIHNHRKVGKNTDLRTRSSLEHPLSFLAWGS